MSETIVVPDSGNNNMNNALPWLAMGNNNGLLGNGGWGAGVVGFILGALINNGWGNGGLFGGNGGGAGAASALGAQATANNNADLIMNAITNQGEMGRQAIQTLSATLGQDFNLVNSAITTIQSSLATIAANQGMNVMQVINAIQSGNAALQSQLCSMCCETNQNIIRQGYEGQIRTIQQTESINGVANANNQRTIDAIADLKTSMVSEFCAARERDMQSKIDTQADIIAQLRSAADNANQTNQILSYVNNAIAPIQAKLTEIASKQLPTVPVVYPQISAVNNTPYNGGSFGFGNSVVF